MSKRVYRVSVAEYYYNVGSIKKLETYSAFGLVLKMYTLDCVYEL